MQTIVFGFVISWEKDAPVLVEASGKLADPVWTLASTNFFKAGWSYFSDPQWTTYLGRFYRIRPM